VSAGKGGVVTKLLIQHGTVIDGTGARPLSDGAVLVVDGRVVAVGAAAAVAGRPDAAGAELVDAAGCWVIPGLIDAHVHATLTGAGSMPVFLGCGVTTVRDVGGPLDGLIEIRDQLAAGTVVGPRFVFSGPLIDGESPSFPNAALPIIASTADGAEAAELAERCIAAGAGSIKLYFRLGRDAVRAAIARVNGRVPVTGHLGRTLASEAAEAGINGLEHVIVTAYNDVAAEGRGFDAMTSSMATGGFWSGLLAGWADVDLDAAPAQRLLELLRERDVTLDPTLDITRTGLGGLPSDEGAPLTQYVRPTLRQAWSMQLPGQAAPDEAARDVARRGHAKCDELVWRYHAMRGRVTAGTDVGAVRNCVPGFSLHGEMRMLRDAGLSNEAVLRAATIDAARALRIDGETGSIVAGKVADLVVLEADPLADVRNVGRVRTVVRGGVAHDAAALLAGAAAAYA
jgi:imidazolonepropionase-like amidohydrolase